MQLRPYQQQAVDAAWEFLRTQDGHPVISLPTGSGKSLVIAELARHAVREWDGRVLVVTHVHELIQQNADKLRTLAPDLDIGIYSASAGSRDTENPVVFVQIQSAFRKAELFSRRDLVLVDECHLINGKDDSTMYAKFLADIKAITEHARVIGLTATPFRLSGPLIGNGCLFEGICYEADLTQLIEDGFLSKLVTSTPGKKVSADLSGVGKTGGEYILAQLGQAMTRGDLVRRTVDDLLPRVVDRKSCIVFACTIDHGKMVQQELKDRGQTVGFVCGDTPGLEREWIVNEFRSGGLKYLVNVNCLSTGFDYPGIDCVVSLRPTESAGLWLQQVGRGFRLAPFKENCLILDYSGNLQKFGPINLISPKAKAKAKGGTPGVPPSRTCPECKEPCAISWTECPVCGYEFPVNDSEDNPHDTVPDQVNKVIEPEIETLEVGYVEYTRHIPKDKGDGKPRRPTLRVSYFTMTEQEVMEARAENNRFGTGQRCWPVCSEWVCIEHDGFAGNKARQWWRKRSAAPFPECVDEAVDIANGGGLAHPETMRIKRNNGSFPEILVVKCGPVPEWSGNLESDNFESVRAGDIVDLLGEDLPF